MDCTINLFGIKGIAVVPPDNVEVHRRDGYSVLIDIPDVPEEI
jgi:hypothetical protein